MMLPREGVQFSSVFDHGDDRIAMIRTQMTKDGLTRSFSSVFFFYQLLLVPIAAVHTERFRLVFNRCPNLKGVSHDR